MFWRFLGIVVALGAVINGSGCTLGPRQIDAGRLKYNDAIQRTFQEEMLLNLVRLKYREIPEFMAVGGVAAQYSFNGSAAVDGTLFEGGPDVVGFDGIVRREERPTITYAPQRSGDFSRGLLAPIGLQTLALLGRTGWSWDRILRCTVQNMNQVDNATSAGGPTPKEKPNFEEFRYLTQQLRELQRQHGVELALAERENAKTLPVTFNRFDGDFYLGALDKGFKFKQREDGTWLMYETEQYAAMVFDPTLLDSPEVLEVTRLLHLQPGRSVYEVELGKEGQIQPASNGIEELPVPHRLPPIETFGNREKVTVSTRSLLETMYYLSQGIQIPEKHMELGLVTMTMDQQGRPFDWSEMTGDLLQVLVSDHRPKCAAVAVPYRGYWFYIDDRDLNSQSTFVLLVELFSIEIRSGGGQRLPVLTLGI